MNANHVSHAFGLGFEVWMPQKTPNEPRRIVSSHVQQNQAIGRMYKISFEEVSILRKESNPPVLMHQWDYL